MQLLDVAFLYLVCVWGWVGGRAGAGVASKIFMLQIISTGVLYPWIEITALDCTCLM